MDPSWSVTAMPDKAEAPPRGIASSSGAPARGAVQGKEYDEVGRVQGSGRTAPRTSDPVRGLRHRRAADPGAGADFREGSASSFAEFRLWKNRAGARRHTRQ